MDDTKDFKTLVVEYIELDSATGKWNEEKMLDLVRHCHCARGTVTRWANGHSAPGPHVRQAIIEYIRKQITHE